MPFSRTEQEIIRIVKRRQMILQHLGRGVGIISLLAIIAFTARLITKRLANRTRHEIEYAEAERFAKESGMDPASRPSIVDLSQRDNGKTRVPRDVSVVDMSKPSAPNPAVVVPTSAEEAAKVKSAEPNATLPKN